MLTGVGTSLLLSPSWLANGLTGKLLALLNTSPSVIRVNDDDKQQIRHFATDTLDASVCPVSFILILPLAVSYSPHLVLDNRG
jgi:hypothetical protein